MGGISGPVCLLLADLAACCSMVDSLSVQLPLMGMAAWRTAQHPGGRSSGQTPAVPRRHAGRSRRDHALSAAGALAPIAPAAFSRRPRVFAGWRPEARYRSCAPRSWHASRRPKLKQPLRRLSRPQSDHQRHATAELPQRAGHPPSSVQEMVERSTKPTPRLTAPSPWGTAVVRSELKAPPAEAWSCNVWPLMIAERSRNVGASRWRSRTRAVQR